MRHSLVWQRLSAFALNEQGSAYTLSYVMVLPFVVIFVMLTAETAMILLAKIGTSYAAFASARTAIVWEPSAGSDVASQKATQAAIQAIAPFANGLGTNSNFSSQNPLLEDQFLEMLRESSSTKAGTTYLRKKFRYSENAIKVSISKESTADQSAPWEHDIKSTVEYKYTFHVPFIARFFASADGRMTIRSKATLPSESPMNPEQSLGISYASQK